MAEHPTATPNAPPRIVLYVKDHGTSGPIARAAQVAHALQERGAQVQVMLREEIAGNAMLGEGIDVLPYRVPTNIWPDRLDPARQLKKLRPDILLVDEYPFVNQHDAPEWERVIDAGKRANPALRVAGMTCDIPIYPKDVEAAHVPRRAHRVDEIFITGDPSVIDFKHYVEPGEAASSVRDKLGYVGFMQQKPEMSAAVASPSARPRVLVYLGGHAQDHERQYLSLMANIPHMSEALRHADWEFILPAQQHLMVQTKIDAMYARLPDDVRAHVHLTPAGSPGEFTEKLKRADMAVTGGGQTAIESSLLHGVPTVIVPTRNPEQHHRMRRFAEAMPEHVAGMGIPSPGFKQVTRARLVYEVYYQKDTRDWVDKTLDWAATDPDAAKMRDTMDRIFAQREHKRPNSNIMLDGAQHIAERLTQPATEAAR
ncbi:MAG: hypothetical protein DI582_09330 [Azospirillum brasilense]|nr:MAG: hypothetical protein DI582_09330 [Azospirillum brasilense]